jgi:hypothetical protein
MAATPAIDWTPPKPRVEDRELRPPAPRKRRRTSVDLADVTFRDLVQHRLRMRLPDDKRKKVHEVRRSRPFLDRLMGPR